MSTKFDNAPPRKGTATVNMPEPAVSLLEKADLVFSAVGFHYPGAPVGCVHGAASVVSSARCQTDGTYDGHRYQRQRLYRLRECVRQQTRVQIYYFNCPVKDLKILRALWSPHVPQAALFERRDGRLATAAVLRRAISRKLEACQGCSRLFCLVTET